MEEVLTGELAEDIVSFAGRARALLAELVLDAPESGALPDCDEIAATAWRTLQLPDIAGLRGRLVPEWPIYGLLADRSSQARSPDVLTPSRTRAITLRR
jgi:hypothetical protein